MTLYAWSDIRYGADDDGKPKSLAYGDTVTAAKLGGVTDEDLQELVDSGAVRDSAPPDMPETFQGSPVDYLRTLVSDAEGGVATSLGASYFGPNEEDMLQDIIDGEVTVTTETGDAANAEKENAK